MSITRVACPFCKAALKSNKPMPPGKQITCVKCQQRFAVSAELQLGGTGDSHAGTSFLLAETQAGLLRSPMAETPADPPRPTVTPAVSTSKKAANDKRDFRIGDGKSIVSVPRRRRSWGGLLTMAALLLIAAGVAYLAINSPQIVGPLDPPDATPVARQAKPRSLAQSKPVETAPAKVVQLPPQAKSLQEKIDYAVDRGVNYLKGHVTSDGNWKSASEEPHPVGYAALPALALLECKLPVSEPIIARAAEFVRNNSTELADTYDLGLAVLLLDRLGDPRDVPLLRNLAMRLVAGQNAAGGWDYKCPVLPLEDSKRLLSFLQGHRPKIVFMTPIVRGDAPLKQADAPRKAVFSKADADLDELPASLRGLPIVTYHASKATAIKVEGRDDNSNTQFGLLGLWAARRHGVPTELSLELVGKRFQETQNPSGGWGYALRGPSKNTMTCVGLLGLAMSHGAATEAYLDAASKSKIPRQPPTEDKYIKQGMWALGQFVDGDDSRRGLASRIDYYYLWTLERVGMLYRRDTFGQQDWYKWGAETLLDGQLANGSWHQHYDPAADTSFALLFLKRSDLVRELTSNLQFYIAMPK